jgi:hypothetical protein
VGERVGGGAGRRWRHERAGGGTGEQAGGGWHRQAGGQWRRQRMWAGGQQRRGGLDASAGGGG